MNLDSFSIMDHVQKQVRKRVSQKYNWKRIVSSLLNRLEKRLLQFISGDRSFMLNSAVHSKNLDLGVDEFGRDVALYLKEYVNLLLSRGLNLHTVIVLGSRAKGRWVPESDIDVMVIASNLPGIKTPNFTNVIQKILNLRQKFLLLDYPLCLGVQPSACCSKEDFLRWLLEFNVTALDAVYYGKVVYDDGFWEDVKKIFNEMNNKYRLDETLVKKMLWIL